MAADSDGCKTLTTTVLTCEGNLSDPEFTRQFKVVVGKLNGILGEEVKIHKLEPWNSVRVTLSIPREAALHLRKLASEGSQQLRALGILSVQVEGDQVISLRIASNSVNNAEPQEILLQTTQDASSSSSSSRQESDGPLSRFLSGPAASSSAIASTSSSDATEKVPFKSPNVVCPSDSVVPKVPVVSATGPNSSTPPATKGGYGGPPFPFTSMNQAIHSSSRDTVNYQPPPPPYPGINKTTASATSTPNPAVTISSPLLVNLLQNDGCAPQKTSLHQKSLVDTSNSAVKLTSNNTLLNNNNLNNNNRTTVQQNTTFVQKPSPSSVPPQTPMLMGGLLPSAHHHQQQPVSQNGPGLRTIVANRTVLPNNNALVVSKPHLGGSSTTTIQLSSTNSITTTTTRCLTLTNTNHLESEVVTLNTNNNNIININNKSCLNVQHPAAVTVVPKQQQQQQQGSPLSSQASSSLLSSSSSPSALSTTNTSIIRQNSSIQQQQQPNSTISTQQNNIMTTVNNNNINASTNFSSQILQNAANMPLQQQQQQQTTIPQNNLIRNLPPPPPYSVAVNRQWDTLVQTTSTTSNSSSSSPSPYLDLTPSLTDLKVDDLEDLLPTLERDLAGSPLELPEDFHLTAHTNDSGATLINHLNSKQKNFLINPLTGELEPQSSGDEGDEPLLGDVFTGLPSPAALSDDDTNSTFRPDTTDQSDSETRSSTHSDSGKHTRSIKSKGGRSGGGGGGSRSDNGGGERSRDSTSSPGLKNPEKIKLRLKLEKNEPINNSAYKVDVSFIPQPKKASTSVVVSGSGGSSGNSSSNSGTNSGSNSSTNSPGEELRVPPLHISLRGRRHFITNKKKKLNADGTPATKLKARKQVDSSNKINKRMNVDGSAIITNSDDVISNNASLTVVGQGATETIDKSNNKILTSGSSSSNNEQRKVKKFKSNNEHNKDNNLILSSTANVISNNSLLQDSELISKLVKHNNATTATALYNKEQQQQKERRGSDSELSRTTNLKFIDNNGGISVEKKRRLSQSELIMNNDSMTTSTTSDRPTILGSTNVGTIPPLAQKVRNKDKISAGGNSGGGVGLNKIKDGFNKVKEIVRNKSLNKIGEKFTKQVVLPTGEIDMEAKFKQRLMEGSEKGIARPPHRTDGSLHGNDVDKGDNKILKATITTPLTPTSSSTTNESDSLSITSSATTTTMATSKEKSPEPDKCNTPDRNLKSASSATPPSSTTQTTDLVSDKQAVVVGGGGGGRSPNSGQQGEDSGIESMDALSEKSPNQASQSPHADIPESTTLLNIPPSSATQTNTNSTNLSNSSNNKTKSQVISSDMMDIEAQLAKMEGLNGVDDGSDDVNDNNKLTQCCELTTALQDSLNKNNNSGVNVKDSTADINLVSIKTKTKDETTLEPLPVRVTPPLYTYSNPEKGRGSESPPLPFDEVNTSMITNVTTSTCSPNTPSTTITTTIHSNPTTNNFTTTTTATHKGQSLLEQLLIEIPSDTNQTTPSSPSPATRSSVRTRALSKLSSPELNSPVSVKQTRSTTPAAMKRKRHESDSSSNHSLAGSDDTRNKKPRKCSENAAELIKAYMGVDPAKINNINNKKSSGTITSNVNNSLVGSVVVVGSGVGSGVVGKIHEESSDSDEPLIEKVRKTANNSVAVAGATPGKTKLKTGTGNAKNLSVSTRRSVRATAVPTPNTRSKGDKVVVHSESEAIRRKTRSTVSEGESKRKKEVK